MNSSKNILSAETQVESVAVKEFHSLRRLFIIIERKVYAEIVPSAMSHIDWIKTLDINSLIVPTDSLNVLKKHYIIDNYTRGYYYDNNIVFYKGMQFICDQSVVDDIEHSLCSLVNAMGLNDSTKIGLGVVPVKNSIFKIKYLLGTIAEVKKMKDFNKLYEKLKTKGSEQILVGR